LIDRSKIITILRKYKEKNSEQLGILEMGIFGSCARDDRKKNSDVDVVVKLSKQDMYNLIGIKQDLEESFMVHVDVVSYRERMNQFLKQRIDDEAIYV